MAGNEIKLTFAGDSSSLEKSFDRVGAGAKDMANDLTSAGKEAGRFDNAIGGLNNTVGASESKFMGAADLADGLSTALGLNLGPTIEMSRAFGDMAGGFDSLVGPALEKMSGRFKNMSIVTKAQTAATSALNMVMRANPILLVVTAIAALTAGFIIAYKRSETFRNIVDGAMSAVKDGAMGAWNMLKRLFNGITDGVQDTARVMGRVADIITTPYQMAFRAIASLWNNTVGRLSFTIPGWVPGIGGNGFDVPDIPMLAKGGTAYAGRPHIVGERGPELFIPNSTGAVVPNGAFGGGVARVELVLSGDAELVALMRKAVKNRGGNVQAVLGAA